MATITPIVYNSGSTSIYHKKNMEMLKTIKDRWCSKTPMFFQNIKKLMLTLSTSSSAVWMANESMNLQLHPTSLEVCKYLIAISVASGLTAQLTKDQQQTNQ